MVIHWSDSLAGNKPHPSQCLLQPKSGASTNYFYSGLDLRNISEDSTCDHPRTQGLQETAGSDETLSTSVLAVIKSMTREMTGKYFTSCDCYGQCTQFTYRLPRTSFKKTRVWLFRSHQQSRKAFQPTQTSHASGFNIPRLGSSVLNKAVVNATQRFGKHDKVRSIHSVSPH